MLPRLRPKSSDLTILTDESPEGATQFKEGKWGCIMWLASVAFKGRPAVADINTFGCLGGGTGLGFGNQYLSWPGGIECFYAFLSNGNEHTEHGRRMAELAQNSPAGGDVS